MLESWSLTLYGHRSTPAAPLIDSATSGSGSLTVAWSAPVDSGESAIDAYDLRYIGSAAPDKADANWSGVDDVWTSTSGGAFEHTISPLTTNVLYDVQVRAVNTQGDGLWSATATAIPVSDAVPTILSATPGEGSIAITWAEPATGTGFTSYDLRYVRSDAPNKGDAFWSVAGSTWTSGSLEFTLSPTPALSNGVSYDLQVRSVTGTNDGPWSSIHSATPRTVPDAPTIDHVAGDDAMLTVEWDAPAVDGGAAITSYDLRYIKTEADETADANWIIEASVWTSGEQSATVTGLENGVSYDVQVRALNPAGAGDWSASSEGVAATVPGIPTIGAITADYTELTVQWSAPADDGGLPIEYYQVRYIRSDAADKADDNWVLRYYFDYSGNVGSADPMELTLRRLATGASYDVQVRAVNDHGRGDWSATTPRDHDSLRQRHAQLPLSEPHDPPPLLLGRYDHVQRVDRARGRGDDDRRRRGVRGLYGHFP